MYKKLVIAAAIVAGGALSSQACSSCGCQPKKAEKKTDGKAQTTCPLMGGKINKKIFADHGGKRVYFCCKGCIGAFKKNPQKYIKALESKGVKLDKAPKKAHDHSGHDHSGHDHGDHAGHNH